MHLKGAVILFQKNMPTLEESTRNTEVNILVRMQTCFLKQNKRHKLYIGGGGGSLSGLRKAIIKKLESLNVEFAMFTSKFTVSTYRKGAE